MKYKCTKCKKFLGEIKKINLMNFAGTRRIDLVGNKLIVTCKCKGKNIIDLKPFQKKKGNP